MPTNEEIVREALHALATLAGNFEAAPNRVPRLINEQVATIGLSLDRLVAERDELERLRKPLIVALAQAEAEVARLREYADRMVVQVDELTEGRIERNAEVARLRKALTVIAEWDCLNPPDSELCADHPWLKRHVDAALGEDA